MASRTIGIDYDGTTLRVVALRQDKGREELLHHGSCSWDGVQPIAALLRERLGVLPEPGDHLTIALPPSTGLTRTLSFPFSDRRKVAAAIPLELAAQLPIPLDDCTIDHQLPRPVAAGVEVATAVVPKAAIAAALAPFEAAGITVQRLDLLPSALASGLAAELDGSLALCLCHQTAIILLCRDGELLDHRVVPLRSSDDPSTAASVLVRELLPFQRRATDLPLLLFGSGLDGQLEQALAAELASLQRLATVPCGSGMLHEEYFAALALARQGFTPQQRSGFNFLRHNARHSEWSALKKQLFVVGTLLGLTLLIVLVSAGLRWWWKTREADQLKRQLTAVYREAVPGEGSVVDVPLQLRARLAELTHQSRPGGQHPGQAPLALFRELSLLTPAGARVTVRELGIDATELRVEAFAPSFDVASQLQGALAASPLFQDVRIAESRTSADGGRVEFRLVAKLRPAEDLP